MRLFLSSQDLGKYADVAAKMAGKNKKAVFFKNAQDNEPPDVRNFSTPQKKIMFEDAGFEFEEIDLRDFFGKQSGLRGVLNDYSLVWIMGGNTFVLRRALKASGADKLIAHQVKSGKIAYGGESAGSIVATPSLHGTELGDNPNFIPEGYKKEIVWDGLNLVRFHIVPHYKSDWFGKEADDMLNYMKKHKQPYETLTDSQAFVVDGEREKLLK